MQRGCLKQKDLNLPRDDKVQMIHRSFMFMVPTKSANTELIIFKRQIFDIISTSKFLQRNLNFGLSSGGIRICKYISLTSQATAIGKRRKRRSTSNRFVNSLGSGRMRSFKDIPWNLALASNTILVFVVDLSGRHSEEGIRYQVLFGFSRSVVPCGCTLCQHRR